MPVIKPISDLRNYNQVLEKVSVGSPVYLTKNGHGCYTIMDINEQEEMYEKEIRTKNVDNGIDCSNDLQFSTGSCGDRFGE